MITKYEQYVKQDYLISPRNGYICKFLSKQNIQKFGYDSLQSLREDFPDFPSRPLNYKNPIHSKNFANERKEMRIKEYNLNPNKCNQCHSTFSYNNRNKKFCNSSCAATFNNLNQADETKSKRRNSLRKKYNHRIYTCLSCGNEISSNRERKFCNSKCRNDHRSKSVLKKLVRGEIKSRPTIRKYLINIRGDRCQKCGINEWMGEAIILEVHHVDKNSDNNFPSNILLLCPNCHYQQDRNTIKQNNTTTYRSRYIKNRYEQGKWRC